MTTVAVMQPYFMPYAGYFRLFAAADLFVIYDCVQFPRRGWVHRNRLPDAHGASRWLTLPLHRCARETRICDLQFGPQSIERWNVQLRRFAALRGKNAEADTLVGAVRDIKGRPVDFLGDLLGRVCERLDLPFHTLASSRLDLPPHLKGEDRILEILHRVGATTYLNAPGGRRLYHPETFARHGLKLRFLSEYDGPAWSLLHRLLTEPPRDIAREIRNRI